jgi:hypothetical protein
MKTTRTAQTLTSLSERIPRLLSRSAADPQAKDKGPKSHDAFEVWHHHAALRRPAEWDLLLQFDERR